MKPLRAAPTGGCTTAEDVNEAPAAEQAPDAGADEVTVSDAGGWTPVLCRSVMLRHDRVRGTDLLLMPERVVVLRGSAGAVLRLCDGRHEVAAIVAELAERYPGASVAVEVPEFLGRLREEGWIR